MARNPPPLSSPWLWAYAAVAAAHLTLSWLALAPGDSITKCFLAPVLIGWALTYLGWSGGRTLSAALFFCFLGDLFLELPDSFFIPGMLAFAVAHGFFITLYRRDNAMAALRARPWSCIVYLMLGVGLVVLAWDGLPLPLRVAVPAYALLLIGTACTALAVSWMAGIGAALFLVSDALILLSVAKVTDKGAPEGFSVRPGILIMPLYMTAILLMTIDLVMRQLKRDAKVRATAQSSKQPAVTSSSSSSAADRTWDSFSPEPSKNAGPTSPLLHSHAANSGPRSRVHSGHVDSATATLASQS